MASVRQKPSSRYWFACITRPDGKQRQFSTGLKDREEALAVARAAESALSRKHSDPHALRTALSRIADDFEPIEDQNPAQWLRQWAQHRRQEVSPGTATLYEQIATEASTALDEAGIRSFSALTPAIVRHIRDDWAARHSPSTANKKLKILRLALNSAPIQTNPAKTIPPIKAAPTIRREFRPDELAKLLEHLTGEWLAITLLSLYTGGQRLNDLATLKWSAIDAKRGNITFHASKTGRLVSLPLVPQVLDAIAELPAGDSPTAPLFPSIAAMGRTSRSNAFRTLLAEISLARPIDRTSTGEKSTRRQPGELGFHSLRHTATTLLKSAGVSDSIAMAIVGHSSAAVSRSYTHFDDATLRTALEKMNPITQA